MFGTLLRHAIMLIFRDGSRGAKVYFKGKKETLYEVNYPPLLTNSG